MKATRFVAESSEVGAINTVVKECIKELRLPTVLSYYEQQAEEARRKRLSYEQYLAELMNDSTILINCTEVSTFDS